ncbi:hypothetical protein ABZZ80_43580 [Streptomyces sp. NPDC006356]
MITTVSAVNGEDAPPLLCLGSPCDGAELTSISIGAGPAAGPWSSPSPPAGIGILTYAAHTFAGQLGAEWLAYLSPFHYYIGGQPLKHVIQWADAGILAAASVALLPAGTYRFNRRDLNG